nr:hypothetical protein [Bacillus pseudomycoides]
MQCDLHFMYESIHKALSFFRIGSVRYWRGCSSNPGVIVDTPIIQGYNDSGLIDVMKTKVTGNKLTQPEQIADTVYLISLEEASLINSRVVIAYEGYASFK